MIVKLKKKNSGYRDLTFGQSYVVIGVEADDLRILNDAGRPFLYPRNLFSMIDAVLEDSGLDAAMKKWDQIDSTWEELSVLPTRLKSKLSEWRGIYYIFDTSDRKGYVGSAYGESNLLGRWLNYAARGDGGNKLLRSPRDPRKFRFTILQRVSPDMNATEVTQLEKSWKIRLHTHAPDGLNDN